MHRRSSCALLMVSGVAIAGAGMVGCESQNRRADASRRPTTPTDLTDRAGRTYGTMSESLMSSSSMAFPTGDEDTSAVLIEKALPREIMVGEQFEYQIRVTNLTDQPLTNVVIREFTEAPGQHDGMGGHVRAAPAPAGRNLAAPAERFDSDARGRNVQDRTLQDRGRIQDRDQNVQGRDQKWYDMGAEHEHRPPGPGMLGEEKVPSEDFNEGVDQQRDRLRGIDDVNDFDVDVDADADADGVDVDVDTNKPYDATDELKRQGELRSDRDRLHPLGAAPDGRPLDRQAGAQQQPMPDGRVLDEADDDRADLGPDPDRIGEPGEAVGPYRPSDGGIAGVQQDRRTMQRGADPLGNRTFGMQQELEQQRTQLQFLDQPAAGRAGSPSGAEYVIDYLAPGETRTIAATAIARDPGLVQFCSTVTYSPVLCSTAMVIAPSLELTKSAPQVASVCEPIAYTLTVTNTGVGPAEGVTITEALPEGVRTADGQSEININVGTLAAGESRDFTVNLRAEQPGQFTSTARATSARGLTAEASSATRLVQPQIEVEKIGPAQAYTGVGLDFLVNVRNVGDIPVNNIRVVDQAPAGAQFVRATEGGQFSGNQTTWVLPTLGPGESRTLAVRLEGTQAGTFDNCVQVLTACGQPVQDCTTVTLEGVTGLRLVVLDRDDPISIGDDELYTVTVENQGNAEATNVQIAVDVPQEHAFVSAAGPQGRSITPEQGAQGVITFPVIAVLAPGQRVDFTIITRGQTAGDTRFAARLTADQLSQPVIAQESTHVFDATPAQPQLRERQGEQPGQQPGAGNAPRGPAPAGPAPRPEPGQPQNPPADQPD